MLKGSQAVIERFRGHSLVTINLVYGEVYYFCLRTGLDTGKLKNVHFELLDYTKEDIEKAMELLLHRKGQIKDFSFVDSVVYEVARKNRLILATKDFGFRGLPDVEMIS